MIKRKKRSKKKRVFLPILALLLLIGAGYFIFGGSPMEIKVVKAQVTKNPTEQIFSQGEIVFKNSDAQYTSVDGVIVKTHVKEGDEITEDQPLIDIEVSMGEETFIKQIKSLHAGEVVFFPYKKGDFIDRGEQVTIIGDSKEAEIIGHITEFDYLKVEKGDQVIIDSNAYSEDFVGKIHSVSDHAVPGEDEKGTLFKIHIDVDFNQHGITPVYGLHVFLTIDVEKDTEKSERKIYHVPETSVIKDGNQHYVYVIENDNVEKRLVEIKGRLTNKDKDKGIGNDQFRIWIEKEETAEEIMSNLLEVTQGITEDDVIIVNPQVDVSEGDTIETKSLGWIN